MEISNTLANYRISIERIRNTLLESLRNGQIVQAKAVTSSEQMQVQLRIGKLEIVAHTSAKIAAGDDLTLQVVKAANPLQLKIVKEVDARRIEAEVMRSVLPQQASIGLLMKRQPQAALEHLERLISAVSASMGALFDLSKGWAYLQLGAWDDAVRYLDRVALGGQPSGMRGLVEMVDGICEDLVLATEHEGVRATAVRYLGHAKTRWEEQGNTERAERCAQWLSGIADG